MRSGRKPFLAAAANPVTGKIPAISGELSPGLLSELLARDEVELIDVREPYERAAGHIPGSTHVPLAELTDVIARRDWPKPIVFQCRLGVRSALATQAFRRAGIEAHNLEGGILGWTRAGLPLVPEGAYVADH